MTPESAVWLVALVGFLAPLACILMVFLRSRRRPLSSCARSASLLYSGRKTSRSQGSDYWLAWERGEIEADRTNVEIRHLGGD